MKSLLSVGAVAFFLVAQPVLLTGDASAKTPQQNKNQASKQSTASNSAADRTQGDIYYYYTLGHLQEQDFLASNGTASAQPAIDSYQKALAIDPNSADVMVRLATVYAASQRIRDAVAEAQMALKIDPDNVDAHRLLARIYVQTIGDVNAGDIQQANLQRAVTEFEAVLKTEPNDENSILWLSRLYGFQNKKEQAEKILRQLLQHNPDDDQAVAQLSQILMDGGRPQEAIDLLKLSASNSGSPDLYDMLGDAYGQMKDFPDAESAYKNAIDADPDDAGHRHGLAQTLTA